MLQLPRPAPLSRLALACFVAAAALAAGCASGGRPDPTPLAPVDAKIAGSQVWSARIGAVSFPLTVGLAADRFHVASDDGMVTAFDANGQTVWQGSAGGRIAAGVGSDGRFAAVVTRDNELVVMEGGAQRWRAPMASAVATAPLVAGERVFVVGVDRSVRAYDALDGRWLWQYQRAGETLLLAQPTVLSAYRDNLIVGQGSRWVVLDPTAGTVRWEAVMATPRGTNEIERLSDLIGPATRSGSVFCARGFQAAVGCIDADKQMATWSQLGGGTQAVGGNADTVFSADGADRMSARKRSNGDLVWSSDRLMYRSLCGPVALGNTVVFGDFEGYLHFLSADKGDIVLRLRTDSSGMAAPLTAIGNTLLAVTRDGGVYAYKPQ